MVIGIAAVEQISTAGGTGCLVCFQPEVQTLSTECVGTCSCDKTVKIDDALANHTFEVAMMSFIAEDMIFVQAHGDAS